MIRWSIVLLLFYSLSLRAGDGTPWSLGARAHGGVLAPHHTSMWVMIDGHAWAGELFLQRSFSGSKVWHGNYLAPRWGLSALWLDAGSDRLGNTFRLLPYLELPLVPPGNWELTARFGWGLGVVEQPFDRVGNYKQHAIGSHLNLAAVLGLTVRRVLGRGALDLCLSIDHLSNGSMQQPNLGVNVATLALGYSHRLSKLQPRSVVPDTTGSDRSRSIVYAMANGGWNEVYPLESGRRTVVSLSASAYRTITGKGAFGAGVDLFNKGTIAVVDTGLAGDPRISLSQVGLHAGYAMLFGDMTIYFETGAYLYTPIQERAAVYTRLGMRHQFSRRLFANLSLKSHFFVADHMELGLGYCFR